MLGRHPKALAKLGRLFSGRDTEKTYWAVVEGSPPADEGVFDMPLLKLNTRTGWSVKVSDKGQPSVTRYKVLGRAPGMTGLELLPRVKAARPDLPVIMITAYGDPDTRRKAEAGGADGLLIKPIDFAALRSEIDTRLTGREAVT